MRLEVHKYDGANSAEAIEPLLRKVIANNLEGLVLKNPRSSYMLNDRNDDWIKVKPDYMNEWGEEVDCVVIGARYGSGPTPATARTSRTSASWWPAAAT